MTFPSIPSLSGREAEEHTPCFCRRSSTEQSCLVKPYWHTDGQPVTFVSFMNVRFTSWCGHWPCYIEHRANTVLKKTCVLRQLGVTPNVQCVHCLSVRLLVAGLRCRVQLFGCEQSRWLLSLILWNKNPQTNLRTGIWSGGEDSTQHLLTVWVLSFSCVNYYQCIFKCEIYCRGILTFNCDAFNWTLCALITLLFLCRVYWCPFSFTANLLCLFYFSKKQNRRKKNCPGMF